MKNKQEITAIRHKYKLSQKKLADILECSVKTIQEWDQGRRNCPPAMLKLAKLLLGDK